MRGLRDIVMVAMGCQKVEARGKLKFTIIIGAGNDVKRRENCPGKGELVAYTE